MVKVIKIQNYRQEWGQLLFVFTRFQPNDEADYSLVVLGSNRVARPTTLWTIFVETPLNPKP